MGNENKRVKGDIIDNDSSHSHTVHTDIYSLLKGEINDLQFIISHLRDDIVCTIQGNEESLKRSVEREIAVLVYGVLEDSVKREIELGEIISSLKKENEVLIENEGGMMDELARLTIENDALKNGMNDHKDKDKDKDSKDYCIDDHLDISAEISVIKADICDLEKVIYGQFLATLKRNLIESKLKTESIKIELENSMESFNEQLLRSERLQETLLQEKGVSSNFRQKIQELEEEVKALAPYFNKSKECEFCVERSLEIESIKTLNSENLSLVNKQLMNLELSKEDQEKQIKELMNINCELMDLSELSKIKDEEMRNKLDLFRTENLNLKEELENLKKVMTAQKIELERARETLKRERKLSFLKISDLQEQLEDGKFKFSILKDVNVNDGAGDDDGENENIVNTFNVSTVK